MTLHDRIAPVAMAMAQRARRLLVQEVLFRQLNSPSNSRNLCIASPGWTLKEGFLTTSSRNFRTLASGQSCEFLHSRWNREAQCSSWSCSFHSARCLSEESTEHAEVQNLPLKGKSYETITAELVGNSTVGVLMLNRPKVLNALSHAVMHEMVDALQALDSDPEVGAIVITGKGKAFAAGVDIKEMKDKTLVDAYLSPFIAKWNDVSSIRKPILAAVNGYALGGGCELAMMCDIILVGEKAVFGQPEIKLGTIPGMGGTQRLIREVGKSRAMEMILTGQHFMDAKEACERGLASRVVPGTNEDLVAEAVKLAKTISELSRPAMLMAKAAVNAAYENSLQEGIRKEQALFGATFGLADQKEGMNAFVEKRKPNFGHK